MELKTNRDNVMVVLGSEWCGVSREMWLNNINYIPHYVLYSICFSVMKMELINQTFTVKHNLIILAFKQLDSSHSNAHSFRSVLVAGDVHPVTGHGRV